MKKSILIAFFALITLVVGCAKTGDTITIDEIAAANTEDQVLSRHAAFSIHTVYYDADGNESFTTDQAIGKSGDQYAASYEDSDGYSEFLDAGTAYFRDPTTNEYSVLAFYPGMLDEYVASYDDYLFLSNEGSVIGAATTSGGETKVDVTLSRTNLNAPFLDSLGFGSPDSIRIAYSLDANTKEVRGYTLYAVTGGKESQVLKASVSALDQPPTAPDFVAQLKNPAETRTITVVSPDGSQAQYVVAKEALFTMSFPEQYGAYLDPEGQNPVTAEDLRGQDATIYLLTNQA